MADSQRPVRRVLSLDGGGIRGIIPALVVAHLERKLGAPASELFDLIVGTSTGGFLDLGLALQDSEGRCLLAANCMAALFDRHGAVIFERSLWRKLRTGGLFEEAYSHEALEKILHKYFGDKKMSDCGTPVMVTSYDIERRKTVFLKSWHADHRELLCAEASRATSAAPTFLNR